MKIFKYISLIICTVIFTQSCTPVVVGGAAATGVAVAAQDRSAGRTVDDTAISTQIKDHLISSEFKGLFTGVGVEVHEGRVMLTGLVNSYDAASEAVKRAWQVGGVVEVINEIQVDESQEFSQFEGVASDSLITSQIKSRLLFTSNIRSANYAVETVRGIVYILGAAQNDWERDAVLKIASVTSGVKNVIGHIKVRSGK